MHSINPAAQVIRNRIPFRQRKSDSRRAECHLPAENTRLAQCQSYTRRVRIVHRIDARDVGKRNTLFFTLILDQQRITGILDLVHQVECQLLH